MTTPIPGRPADRGARSGPSRQRAVAGALAGSVVLGALSACSASAPPAPTQWVVVGDEEFRVEVAATPEARRIGLSEHPSLSAGTGMLFVYDQPTRAAVTMAGMAFPLDVAWIRDDRLVGVVTLEPCPTQDRRTCPLTPSPQIDAFLEVPAGSLTGVAAGSEVTLAHRGD